MKDSQHIYLCLRCGRMLSRAVYTDPEEVQCPRCRRGTVYWKKQLIDDLGVGVVLDDLIEWARNER